MQDHEIALLGTGLMGAPMARNIAKAGFPLAVWNRSRNKAEPLAEAGATVHDTVVDAVAGADVVITMLSDGIAVGSLVTDATVTAAMKPGALWIDMSSTKPEEARAQAAHLADLGFQHLDAPVSGGTKGAEAGTLAIMAGGDADAFTRAAPVLNAMGRPVHVGPTGSGQLSKLANQAIVAVTIAAVAEAMLLVQKGGADPAAVRAALKGGFADSTILQQHGERMTEGNFVPGGLSKFQLKDLDNLLNESGQLGLSLPTAQMTRDRFADFVENMDGADKDHSGLYLELLQRNEVAA
ncbi:2-hydroxy-3-oxopropionate reductase [Litoreibacter meonggei]|uniref:2-hydroxy-3-oxopropionate reductase n=1 Tax=Litoreibacter meonggei TaxID=1049199 RepID=A0A497X168_9RHOB|nr:NAD(P)-dependent oxidoreductase [Litoreibacter meonggei]RLJ59265.1 2-hydroxy-3-oxopropionate reductase [Litoreibacter meonggei]